MDFSVNLPINSVSFGQVSFLILRELFNKKLNPLICPIGNQLDFSSQQCEKDLVDWINSNAAKFPVLHNRKNKIFKLWHLNGSLESYSDSQCLFSFYELDKPTSTELNIVKNNDKVVFSSKYSCEIFKSLGCKNIHHIPLAFDKYNFNKINKNYFPERIVFNLTGKLEKRKKHSKIIKAWVKKFGNNPKYHLQCAVYNPFFKPEDNQALINSILENKNYFNVSFLSFMQDNKIYNDYLNSSDIIIGMSGGEGWGLPEFHSVALGKHSVILNAHAYKDWANNSNSILVEPSGMEEVYDNVFFQKNSNFNQGNIFDFNEDDFISACEKACERVEKNRVNEEGLQLQDTFSSEKMVDNILNILK